MQSHSTIQSTQSNLEIAEQKAFEAIRRLAERVKNQTVTEGANQFDDVILLSREVDELYEAADRYNIPYVKYPKYLKHKKELLELDDKVENWESLLARADELGVDWDESEYDPVALRDELEEQQHRLCDDEHSLRSWYYSTQL